MYNLLSYENKAVPLRTNRYYTFATMHFDRWFFNEWIKMTTVDAKIYKAKYEIQV